MAGTIESRVNNVTSSGGGGGGIASINGDTSAAQLISGANGIAAATASGTTTIQRGAIDPTSTSYVELFDDLNMGAGYLPADGNSRLHPGGVFNLWGEGLADVQDTGGRPGQVSLTGNSGNQLNCFLFSGGRYGTLLGNGTEELACAVYIPVLPNGTNNYTFYFGYGDLWYSQSNCVFMQMNTGQSATYWTTTTGQNGTTYTYGTTTIAMATGWHNLKVRINAAASSATFYVDGVLGGTTTTNIPTTVGVSPFVALAWQSGANATVTLDWLYRRYQLTSARGTY